jgi:Flp pilus assembly protein TadG
MNPTRHLSAPRRPQAGSAIVEFALMLTVLVSIVAGVVEFGRTFWYYDALSKATRNAARAVSVSNPATIATVGVVNAKIDVNAAAASAGVPSFSTSNVSVVCLDATMNTATCANGTAPAGVRVSITGYSVFLGSRIPFLVGAGNTYTVNLAPATTMAYMR